MFVYQQSFFTPTKEVTPELFWALVGAPWTQQVIEGVRENKRQAALFREAGDENAAKVHEEEASRLKKKLPAFIFQATFDVTKSKKGYEGAWRKQAATRLNGLCVLDVDHVENPREVFQNVIIEKCKNAEMGILLVYVTPSGHGLKVVFKADPAIGNLIDNQMAMAKMLGVEADESCKDASRMSFICTKEDILFINEQELFTYENKTFAEKFDALYRSGHSEPYRQSADRAADAGGVAADGDSHQDGAGHEMVLPEDSATYHGVTYADIIREWLGGHEPQRGDRHTTLLRLARDLRYICDRNAEVVRKVLIEEQWVRDLMAEGDAVETTIKDACDYKYYATMPKHLREVLEKVGAVETEATAEDGKEKTDEEEAQLPLEEWGEQIEQLFDHYPCLREALRGLPKAGYAAGLFTTAAFMGTLMTRTWYYFYHRPEERRRLNYCIMVIGDPASGKSFATRLYKLLAAPIKTADKVGYDAVNRYKEETRQKGANKEKPKKPVVIIRDHPARTSNATFIQDMNNAVETIDGEPMHLHMLTFDSELDNATLTQRGGSWIDKTSLELKAFHNEEDGQAYSNLDSISGTFNVYWNFVYTGTPLSLQRKVTERNFGSGLATRLAVIPLPPSGFRMMELHRTMTTDHAADELLKTWAFRLDGVRGELPLWPLVEEAWQWTDERMKIAAFNQDKVEELLLKRVAYYGICIAAPLLVMRHWEEWKEKKTLTIDDQDRRLCRLVMDIQYRCQQHFFGEYARTYFDNMRRDAANMRQRASKYDLCYQQLPKEFTVDDVEKTYGVSRESARIVAYRLRRDGYVMRINKGNYRKLKMSLQ